MEYEREYGVVSEGCVPVQFLAADSVRSAGRSSFLQPAAGVPVGLLIPRLGKRGIRQMSHVSTLPTTASAHGSRNDVEACSESSTWTWSGTTSWTRRQPLEECGKFTLARWPRRFAVAVSSRWRPMAATFASSATNRGRPVSQAHAAYVSELRARPASGDLKTLPWPRGRMKKGQARPDDNLEALRVALRKGDEVSGDAAGRPHRVRTITGHAGYLRDAGPVPLRSCAVRTACSREADDGTRTHDLLHGKQTL